MPKTTSNKTIYPKSINSIRKNEMPHMNSGVYLDFTGAGVYNDRVFDEYKNEVLNSFYPINHSLHSHKKTQEEVVEEIRQEILDFVGASKNKFSVIFVASATQALKTIGENFPWKPCSKYAYTKYNHNSVLGIRKYAIRSNSSFIPLAWPPNITELKSIKTEPNCPNLFAFPFEDNFAGTKPSPNFIHEVTTNKDILNNWYILGDVAAYLPTNPLNLSETFLDASVLSFYKILGYPNTGALIISNRLKKHLHKTTFSLHSSLSILEDDEVPIMLNMAVLSGLRYLKEIGMKEVQKHVSRLTNKLYKGLNSFIHSNGQKAIEIYGNHQIGDDSFQGGIVSFNVKRTDGGYHGYSKIVSEASKAGFHLRGGCQCNPGACFESMKISEDKVRSYYDKKTTCGDNNDIIDGIPLGAVRASLGWASTDSDVDSFLEWINDNYVF
ncbi:molybdenum cofactor sulfurase [Histomonas meleagridis]|uniref:molybdenum cofactor sulfurase n=1 Tax=Histomonas meleagridis TaxID=135588 RepID=UPI003559F2F1|nr:molybdenum cofactor sulfurase [Histomonas meleagridis]KAH0804199.1 molybdenum cofactor sulfurase [Histomonas meleagridis]